jgi:hypothetical protein
MHYSNVSHLHSVVSVCVGNKQNTNTELNDAVPGVTGFIPVTVP